MRTYLDIEGTLRLTFYYLNGEEVVAGEANIFERLKSGTLHLDLRERTVYHDSKKMYTFNFEVLENTEYKFDRE
jgi:hypothetical protein